MSDNRKIVPIGGEHKSARSMLAEVMNDPGMTKCWVVTMSENGSIGWGHFGMSRAETAYAGALLQRLAFDDDA